MSSEDFPRQRQVYLSKALKQSGDPKKRPVVVVSIDIRNQYSSTVINCYLNGDKQQFFLTVRSPHYYT